MAIVAFQSSIDIIHYFVQRNQNVRAYKSRLAEAASIQQSYLSKVMKGEAYLSLDQAALLADFWELDEIDKEYFLTSCLVERATVPSLVKFYRDRMDELRMLRDRKPRTHHELFELKKENANAEEFFLDWRFSAILGYTFIPGQSPVDIGRSLRIPLDTVEALLRRLEDFGLVTSSNGQWMPSPTANQKTLTSSTKRMKELYHSAMRSKAESHHREHGDGIHSTGVCVLSKEAFEKINSLIHEFIFRQSQIMSEYSHPEVVAALCIDYFILD